MTSSSISLDLQAADHHLRSGTSSRLYDVIQQRGGQRLPPPPPLLMRHTHLISVPPSVHIQYLPHHALYRYDVDRSIDQHRKHKLQPTPVVPAASSTSASPQQRYRKIARRETAAPPPPPETSPVPAAAAFPLRRRVASGGSAAGAILRSSTPADPASSHLILPAEPAASSMTIHECEDIRQHPTHPVGKFMRDMDISSEEAIRLNLMPYLSLAPRKLRKKYGTRKELTAEERAQLTKERNREHARHNRRRKTIFRRVLEARKRGVPLPPMSLHFYEDGDDDDATTRSEDAATSGDEQEDDEVATTTTVLSDVMSDRQGGGSGLLQEVNRMRAPSGDTQSPPPPSYEDQQQEHASYHAHHHQEQEQHLIQSVEELELTQYQPPQLQVLTSMTTTTPGTPREGISFVGIVHRGGSCDGNYYQHGASSSSTSQTFLPAEGQVSRQDNMGEDKMATTANDPYNPAGGERGNGAVAQEERDSYSDQAQLALLLRHLLPSYPRIASLHKDEAPMSAPSSVRELYYSPNSPLLSAKLKYPRNKSSSPGTSSLGSQSQNFFHRLTSLRTVVTGFPEDRTPDGAYIEAIMESPAAALTEILRRLRIDCAVSSSSSSSCSVAGISDLAAAAADLPASRSYSDVHSFYGSHQQQQQQQQQGMKRRAMSSDFFNQLISPQTDAEDPLHRSVSTASLPRSNSWNSFCETFGGGGGGGEASSSFFAHENRSPMEREYGPALSTPTALYDCLTNGFYDMLLDDSDIAQLSSQLVGETDPFRSSPSSSEIEEGGSGASSPGGMRGKSKLLVSIRKLEILFDQTDAPARVITNTGTGTDSGTTTHTEKMSIVPVSSQESGGSALTAQLPLMPLSRTIGSWTSLGSPTSLDKALSSLAELFGSEISPTTPRCLFPSSSPSIASAPAAIGVAGAAATGAAASSSSSSSSSSTSSCGTANGTGNTQDESLHMGCQLLVELRIMKYPSAAAAAAAADTRRNNHHYHHQYPHPTTATGTAPTTSTDANANTSNYYFGGKRSSGAAFASPTPSEYHYHTKSILIGGNRSTRSTDTTNTNIGSNNNKNNNNNLSPPPSALIMKQPMQEQHHHQQEDEAVTAAGIASREFFHRPLYAELRANSSATADEFHLTLHMDYKYILDQVISEIVSIHI